MLNNQCIFLLKIQAKLKDNCAGEKVYMSEGLQAMVPAFLFAIQVRGQKFLNNIWDGFQTVNISPNFHQKMTDQSYLPPFLHILRYIQTSLQITRATSLYTYFIIFQRLLLHIQIFINPILYVMERIQNLFTKKGQMDFQRVK